jgi:hypothetical protein
MIRSATVALLIALLSGPVVAFQEESSPDASGADSAPAVPSYRGEFRSVKISEEPIGAQRAWETRPYQVAAWVCLDGSPALINLEEEICQRIEVNCQLLDPSGWTVTAGTPPSQWRWKLLKSEIDESVIEKVVVDPELEFYDKLMVIRVAGNSGRYDIEVREVDVKTKQIGPAAMATTRLPSLVGSLAAKLVGRAFMPIARIDEVGKTNKAELRARGIEACVRTEINEDLEPEVVTIKGSPCFIRNTDRLLPVVIRTDRNGNVVKLDAIPFTFIAIENIEGTVINGNVFSAVRAPLAGRKSKRAEKLALVIRPADGSTVLRLVSRDEKNPLPLEGYDVVTVEPDDIKQELEYHGQTDWRGEIRIPPSNDMRMLLVRRGGRRLKKIPVIPGFREELETTITNDETRLLAQGVVTGLENEILSLAVLRQIYQKQIEKMIEDGKEEAARDLLQTYTELENPQDLRSRMADEEIRLKAQTPSQRERQSIQNMFSPLKKIVSSDFLKNLESDIRKWIDSGKVPDEPAVKKEPNKRPPLKGSG